MRKIIILAALVLFLACSYRQAVSAESPQAHAPCEMDASVPELNPELDEILPDIDLLLDGGMPNAADAQPEPAPVYRRTAPAEMIPGAG